MVAEKDVSVRDQEFDTAVTNGLVVSSQGCCRADIYVKGGKIAAVTAPESRMRAGVVIDAKDRYVLPGIIDAHLHPVYADRIDTLSRAAATEGITTLIPYIGAVKAWGKEGGLAAAVDDFITEGQKSSLIDFAVHCTLMQADLDEAAHTIPRLIEQGIVSFKAFMAYAKRGMKLEDRDLLKVMAVVAGHGGILAVHAENGDIIDHMEARLKGQGNETPEFYPLSHPHLSEAEAIFRLLTLGSTTGCPIYVPHVSAAESLEVLGLFQKWGGVEFYAETCPHYLCLTEAEMSRRGTAAKMAPPLRSQSDIEALWKAVGDGRIQVIGSDAAGYARTAKEPLWDKAFDAPNGIPGLETLFRVVYQEGVNGGRLSLPAMVGRLCENPAKIFGLFPQKGTLQPGADADLILVDPEREYTISEAHPELQVDYCMYGGRRGVGATVLTMQRGKVIYGDGQIKGSRGDGHFVEGRR